MIAAADHAPRPDVGAIRAAAERESAILKQLIHGLRPAYDASCRNQYDEFFINSDRMEPSQYVNLIMMMFELLIQLDFDAIGTGTPALLAYIERLEADATAARNDGIVAAEMAASEGVCARCLHSSQAAELKHVKCQFAYAAVMRIRALKV